ncbi:hypothetical protein FB567DRAFT_527829 [Paraphoma chrysanthemicola]|uniref:Uncharacterized protein n=1 Tax=Paraphoma chrysanthemicola TaxID=798071 RepID=A0A8K0R4G4_9PLEO|nr:hypothetical protein FB567DRAFT_527829 [Paraphoma chrysanthemicola]
MSARSRRLQGSMGSSWGDAGYSSDDNVSIHTASDSECDYGFDESDKDIIQEQTDKATPLLSRSTRAISQQRYETPTNTPNRATARHSQTSSSRSTPRSAKSAHSTPGSAEPSFIMPRAAVDDTLSNLMQGYAQGTPTRNSQLRSRKQRPSSSRNTPHASPKVSSRRTSRGFQSTEQQELGPWHYVEIVYARLLLPLVAYFWDVFMYANRHFFKPILGLALGFGILFFGIQMASGLVYSQVATAIAPLCLIPGSSYIIPSMCASSRSEPHADFEDLIKVEGRLEDILDASQDTTTLPATIKDSENAVRELRTLVRYSKLPSRNQLDLEFENFILTASEASLDLSRYNSRIGATIDKVIATNSWTMAVLQGLEEREAATGSVSRVINALTGGFLSPPPTLQQRIFDHYVEHVGKNKDAITGLIQQAQALLVILTNLDERLDTIYSITTNDDQTITKNQDELLSQLWTKLGGNAASVKANAKSLNLLQNISAYRRRALMHVSTTLLKLQEIQAELENLREGVAAPEVLGWREGLSITYHVDVIDKGVESLRRARGEYRKLEHDQLRARANGAGGGEVREIGGGSSNTVTVKAR